MDKQQLKAIIRAARRAGDAELRELYLEVYGALFAGKVTPEIARGSIIDACKQLLERDKVAPQTEGQETIIMEEILKQILAATEKNTELLARIAKSLDKSRVEMYVNGKGKPDAEVAQKTPLNVVDATKEPGVAKSIAAENKKVDEEAITIEQLRAMATKYSAAFGMDDLLALNMKLAGAKKLSQVPKEEYANIYAEMSSRLANEDGKKAVVAKAESVLDDAAPTLADVKAKAKTFLDANGEAALKSVVKAFGAVKISELPATKYAAFIEAISNV